MPRRAVRMALAALAALAGERAHAAAGQGGFAQLLEGVELKFDPLEFSVKVTNNTFVDARIEGLTASELRLEGVHLETRGEDQSERRVVARVDRLEALFKSPRIVTLPPAVVTASFFNATVRVSVVGLELAVRFESRSFAEKAPHMAAVETCAGSIELGDISLANDVINTVGGPKLLQTIWDVFEDAKVVDLSALVCSELRKAVNLDLSSGLNLLADVIDEYQEISSRAVDPLQGERGFQPEWVDFQNSTIFGMAFSAFNSGMVVDKASVDPDMVGKPMDNTISDLVRTMSGGNGQFVFDTNNMTLFSTSSEHFGFELGLIDMHLEGLDTIIGLEPISVYGAHTIGTNISFGRLRLEANAKMKMRALGSDQDVDEGKAIGLADESFRITIDLFDTQLDIALCLGLGAQNGWDLVFGSVLEDPLQCILSIIKHHDFTRTKASVRRFHADPSVAGFVNADVTALVQDSLNVLLTLFGPSGLLALPGIVLTEVPPLLNDGVGTFIHLNDDCPDPVPYEDPWFDFGTDEYFQQLVKVVRDDVIPNLNADFIGPFTEEQSGEIGKYILQEGKSPGALDIATVGSFGVSLGNTKVTGLNSVYDVHFMESPEKYVLRNSFKVGGPFNYGERRALSDGASDESQGNQTNALVTESPTRAPTLQSELSPVSFSLVMEMNFDGPEVNMSFANEFEIQLRAMGLSVELEVLAKVDRYRFNQLEIEELFNFDCVWSRFHGAELRHLNISFAKLEMTVRCIHCTSPAMAEMEKLVLVEENQGDLTVTLNRWIDTVRARFQQALEPEKLRQTIADSKIKCEDPNALSTSSLAKSDAYHAEGISRINLFAVLGGTACAMLLGLVIGCLLKSTKCCRRGGAQYGESAAANKDGKDRAGSTSSASSWGHRFYRFNSTSSDTADIVLEGETGPDQGAKGDAASVLSDDEVDDDELLRRFKSSPLVLHPVTPVPVRFCVVITLLTNIGLFVMGHLIICANVNVTFMVLGDGVPLHGFAGFSIGKSIKDLWTSGIIPLALLLGGLSGAWPYVKVLSMLFSWVAPPRLFSPKRRGAFLMTLDALGKWSLIDVYVLMLIMVAFGVKIKSPQLKVLPVDFYGVYVVVDPDVGLVSFTLAAMLSLCVNNVCVLCHRNALAAQEQLEDRIKASDGPRLGMRLEVARLGAEGASSTPKEGRGARSSTSPRGSGPPVSNYASGDEHESGEDEDEDEDDYPPAGGRQRRFSTWLDSGTDDVSDSRRDLSDEKEALREHVFVLSSGKRMRFTACGQITVGVLIALSFLLVVAGSSVYGFGFKVFGVVGMFMDIDEEGSWMPYSVFDLFMFAVDQAAVSQTGGPAYKLGVFYLSASFLLTAFFMPLVQLVGLALLFFRPYTLHRQKWIFFLAEIYSAWASIDVYIVGLLIAALEMGHISSIMLAPVCVHILPLITDVLVPVGFVQEENATCLYIASSLEVGCALLLAAAFLTNVVNQIILRSAHWALHEREDRVKHGGQANFAKTEVAHAEHPGCFFRACQWVGFRLRVLTFVEADGAGGRETALAVGGLSPLETSPPGAGGGGGGWGMSRS